MWHMGMNSNMNFPAPLAVAGFLAAASAAFLALALLLLGLLAHKIRRASWASAAALAVLEAFYFALLLGFSLGSHEKVLAGGQEKYFCEMDCHLAYSVAGVKQQAMPGGTRYTVTLRTRFDETTTAKWRPRDIPLSPSPRTVQLIDGQGKSYAPAEMAGASLLTSLTPSQSYTTEITFFVPSGAQGLRLLVSTAVGWPDRLVIGDENSWLHEKTYLAI